MDENCLLTSNAPVPYCLSKFKKMIQCPGTLSPAWLKVNPIHHLIFYRRFPLSEGGHHPLSSKATFEIFFASKLQSWWSKGKHSWLWIWRPRVRIPAHPAFSLRKRKGTAGIWTQDPWFQSQLCLPLDHKLMKNAWKIKKILATCFQIQNSLKFW